MPDPGGTISMLEKALAPHFKKVNLSTFLSYSRASFFSKASELREKST
jgi:hypothetical protein